MVNNRFISKEQMDEIKHYIKSSWKLIMWILIIGILITLGNFSIDFLANYRWMETLQFEKVYTTILYSKITLAAIGFILFFVMAFVTIYWIRFTYSKYFHNPRQLPVLFQSKKATIWTSLGLATVFGVIGSTLVQKLGWEVFLKFLNRTNFNLVGPHFGKDVGFYEFTLPFIQFVAYVVLILFDIYRMSRAARIHVSIYIGLFSATLAVIHYIGRYNTLLTDFVNLFPKSVVHGLSYTDKVVNIPKAYALAIVAILIGMWA